MSARTPRDILIVALAAFAVWMLMRSDRAQDDLHTPDLHGAKAPVGPAEPPELVGRGAEQVGAPSAVDGNAEDVAIVEELLTIRAIVADHQGAPIAGATLVHQGGVAEIERLEDGSFLVGMAKSHEVAVIRGDASGYWPDVLYVPRTELSPGVVVDLKLRRAPSLRVLDPSGAEIQDWRAMDLLGGPLTPDEAVQLLPSGSVTIEAPGHLPLLPNEFRGGGPDVDGVARVTMASPTIQEVCDIYLIPYRNLPVALIQLEPASGDVYYDGTLEESDTGLRGRIAQAAKGMPAEWVSAYEQWLGLGASQWIGTGSLLRTGDHAPPRRAGKVGRRFQGIYHAPQPLIVVGEARGRVRLWPTDGEPIDVEFDSREGSTEHRVHVVHSPWIETKLHLRGCPSGTRIQVTVPFRGRLQQVAGDSVVIALPPSVDAAYVSIDHERIARGSIALVPGESRTFECDATEYRVRFVVEGNAGAEVISAVRLGAGYGQRVDPSLGAWRVWSFYGLVRAPEVELEIDWVQSATQKRSRSSAHVSTEGWKDASSGTVHEIVLHR